jgi:catechol 2,3-dioxygenase-like lactoylglutathione lyase family enzyme
MELVGIAHVALPVTDLATTHMFYAEALGLPEATRPDFGFDGYWFQLGGQQIHVFPIPGTEVNAFQHFAVEVADVEAIAIELEGRGIPVRRSGHVPGAGQQVFVQDPTGHQIEFNQPDGPGSS